MTIAEFIMRIAVSLEKPASKNFSISSMTVSLSLHASIPEPIPSDRHKISCPFSNSKNEKLSPETTASSFVRRATPWIVWYLVSSSKTILHGSIPIRFLLSLCCIIVFPIPRLTASLYSLTGWQPAFVRTVVTSCSLPFCFWYRWILLMRKPRSFAKKRTCDSIFFSCRVRSS